MIGRFVPAMVLAAAAVAQQTPSDADQIIALAHRSDDSTLVARVRSSPDPTREALHRLLASAAEGDTVDLDAADRVARAYAAGWQDSFLVRQVALFRSRDAAGRHAKITADSLRLAGNDAFRHEGVGAAVRLWRLSVERCDSLADTAGMAGALGNIGYAFYAQTNLDSAEWYYGRARDLAIVVGDVRTEGNAVGALANVRRDRGDLRQAARLYAEAGTLRERTGDDRGAAADRNNLGLLAQELGDLGGARRAFEEALTLNRRERRADVAATNLLNLGNVETLEGRYAVASDRYQEALASSGDINDRMGMGSAIEALGLLQLRRGDYVRAYTSLERALGIYTAIGLTVRAVQVRESLAELEAARGNFPGAELELSQASTLAGRHGTDPAILAGLALARADVALQFNRLEEADREYLRADRIAAAAGDPTNRSEAEEGHGILLLIRERWDEARRALDAALQTQLAVGDARPPALTRLVLAYADQRAGDTASARINLALAQDSLRALGDVIGEAAALSAQGELDLAEGMAPAAEASFERGIARLGTRPAADVAWRLHAGFGRALRARGDNLDAAVELTAAVDAVERLAGPLPEERQRTDYLSDKWGVYADLAQVELALGRSDAAFQSSERLRARQLSALLALGRIGAAGQQEDTLLDREQDLRRRIAALAHEAGNRDLSDSTVRGSWAGEGFAGEPRDSIASLQDEYATVIEHLRAARPRYAAVVHGDITDSKSVRARLASDQALLEYLVADSTTVAFVLTSDTVAAVPLDVNRSTLATMVEFARAAIAKPGGPVTDAAWRMAMSRLYDRLMGPVEAAGLLDGKRRLLIVPHLELHYLPFAALLRRGARDEFLIQRYDVAYVPSASVWLQLGTQDSSLTTARVLALAPHAQALPGSATEVATIARLFGERATVLTGREASEAAFRRLAPRYDVIHLATSAALNQRNPLFSHISLARSPTEDGQLDVYEVFGLTLRAHTVVLSACQTGLGSGDLADVPTGDDWVGLTDAFLSAGASVVVGTLWQVNDRATADLMRGFYTELESGETVSRALAEAQRAALRNSATAHPFYWAGFVAVGAP